MSGERRSRKGALGVWVSLEMILMSELALSERFEADGAKRQEWKGVSRGKGRLRAGCG